MCQCTSVTDRQTDGHLAPMSRILSVSDSRKVGSVTHDSDTNTHANAETCNDAHTHTHARTHARTLRWDEMEWAALVTQCVNDFT